MGQGRLFGDGSTLSLIDQSGERIAAIFYTAYVAKGAEFRKAAAHLRVQRRPGRGLGLPAISGWSGHASSSSDPTIGDANARLVRTILDTWLPFTDLVMIDPVGSGWSRAAKPDGGNAFWGVRRRRGNRQGYCALSWQQQPLRVAQVSPGRELRRLSRRQGGAALQRDQGISISGILMVSPLLERRRSFGGTRFSRSARRCTAFARADRARAQGRRSARRRSPRPSVSRSPDYLTDAGRPARRRARPRNALSMRASPTSPACRRVVTQSRGFIRDAYVKNLRAPKEPRSSAATTRPSRPTIHIPDSRTSRGPDPLLDGMCRAYGAHSRPMPATSSASRPR
jgi:hypothetical protein